MKIQVTIKTEDGVVYTGEATLHPSDTDFSSRKAKGKPRIVTERPDAEVDFHLEARAFIKRYSQSMSGPKRLTLLVAWLAKGDPQIHVERAKASKQWNKMKALMGGPFNSAYETRARDNAWIGSPKSGLYALLPAWKEIFAK